MRGARKPKPVFAGQGQLRVTGQSGPVAYQIQGDPASLRFERMRFRATLTGDPELVESAFRAGRGTLTLEDGAELRAQMIGHTAGGNDVFVEVFI